MTIGEALDALTVQFENGDKETLFIVQRFQPDEFFTAEQQNRLAQLMQKLRQTGAENRTMNPKEKTELESLIDAELEGSAKRTAKIADKLGKRIHFTKQFPNVLISSANIARPQNQLLIFRLKLTTSYHFQKMGQMI